MAWGISPRNTVTIPLGEYNADHYLTLLFHSFQNLGWRISYFNRDGIIGYTGISWQSYAEEVSVRIINNQAIIKSECVGYQFFFTDYLKNEKNVELLLGEISYVEYHLQNTLTETAQQLIDSIPDNQFIQLDNPPMGHKEKLQSFLAVLTPEDQYQVTPVLVLSNVMIFIVTYIALIVLFIILSAKNAATGYSDLQGIGDIYVTLGFNNRDKVLEGQVWRLLTSVFQHFSILHIVMNMLVLIYVGSLLESKLGKWNYLALYICTGICASMSTVMWHDQFIGAGASGAIFGLFGILLALLSTRFYEVNARRALLISTLIFVGINIIPLGRQVDHAAHLGGLISGYVLGLIAYFGLLSGRKSFIITAASVATVLFVGLSVYFTKPYDHNGMAKLTLETEHIYHDMVRDLYADANDTLTVQRIAFLNKSIPPKLQKMRDIARRMDDLHLTGKDKTIAGLKAKMIIQEALIYDLAYKEILDTARTHNYRSDITFATRDLNQIKYELADLETDDSTIKR